MKRRKSTGQIILHHSLTNISSVSDIDKWHRKKGWSCIGYHYVIRRDGRIEHGRDVRNVGSHAFGRNNNSIGVCFEGNFHRYEPTYEQIESMGRLYHELCRAYGKLKINFHRPHIFNLFEPKSYKSNNSCPGSKLDRHDLKEIILRFL